jgi:hypothetical protein
MSKELDHAYIEAGVEILDETIVVDETTGGKKGAKNIRLHAIPWESLAELGRVFAFGENKYDDYNFRKGYKWSLSFDALQRHLWLFWNREDRDAESALHHMAHAAWHCLVLLFYSLTERGTDDRPT